MRWVVIVGLALVCGGYRWLFYHRRLAFLSRFQQDLVEWLATASRTSSDRLVRDQLYAKDLIEEAEVGIALPLVEPLGLSRVAEMKLRPLDRTRVRDADVVNLNMSGLAQAQGYFQRRRNQSLDPMFWLDYFLRLPAHLIPLLQKGPDLVKQLVQLVWYGVVFYTAYRAGTIAALIEAVKPLMGSK